MPAAGGPSGAGVADGVEAAALRALVGREDVKNGIVFCNRKSEVDVVAKSLKSHGFDAAPIHGDLDQSLRTKTLADFRSGALKILVASDVAARGLDIPDVSHVFNYDVSHHADDYVHRIGRTGRAGKTGQAFMLVTPADDKGLDKVLKLIKMDPQELKLDIDWSNLGGPAPRRDSADKAHKPSSRGGRSSRSEKAPANAAVETVVDTVSDSPTKTAPVATPPAQDEATPHRTRSRRSPRSKIEASPADSIESPRESPAKKAVEKTAERPPAAAEAPVELVTAPSSPRPAAEPQLRQADRRPGGRNERELEPAREGKGFGGDIPAFLRRPITRKG